MCGRWSKHNDPYYMNQMTCECGCTDLEMYKAPSTGASYAKFDSMSPAQKKQMLQKRSSAHTQKTRSELRRQMDQNPLTGMYNRKDIGIDSDPKI